jgi:Flp pilus assembly pilin Flp
MKDLCKNSHGATAVEFALVALPVFLFIFGIVQTGWIVWTDNLLHVSVDTAARCGAVQSTTLPCSGRANMVATATTVFGPLSGAVFSSTTCPALSSGLTGTKQVSFLSVINLTLTAKSCYPNLS